MSKRTRLAILGATGSIGRQALDVVAQHRDRLAVTAVAARSSEQELRALAGEAGAAHLCLEERDGPDALCDMATRPDVDLVVIAIPGIAGLAPTLAALGAGKSVALANKEVLMVAGHLIRAITGGAGERLRPIDGEHCALWQCLVGERIERVARIAITASGGAFRDRPLDALADVTPDEALRHPTWRMGPKVTIDSATLANKGYEVVEAHWLYGLPYERIDVVLHPESVVHALVEFEDGSVKAQLAEPDMRLFIQYALLWERQPSSAPRLDWTRARALNFRPVDPARYPALDIVLAFARSGDQNAMIGLSAADEVAVAQFLRGDIGFGAIPAMLRRGGELGRAAGSSPAPAVSEIVEVDRAVRERLAPALAEAR